MCSESRTRRHVKLGKELFCRHARPGPTDLVKEQANSIEAFDNGRNAPTSFVGHTVPEKTAAKWGIRQFLPGGAPIITPPVAEDFRIRTTRRVLGPDEVKSPVA
jgi:hypothetical protein